MNTPLAFVDLETTGATPTRDRITEIGIVEVAVDGTVSEWSTLVNPETSIPNFIQSMTGITDAMVADAPNLYGLFKSAKEAEKVLFDIANAHGLCHAILGLEKVKPGKPCFARQVRKCMGACVGEEPLVAHTLRLAQSLAKLKLKSWPFHGPAWFKEGEEALVVDHWCYLGTA